MMDSSIPSRNLNTRMTSEEMIDRSSEWTLGCDNALLNRLKDFSNSLVSQAEGITKDCDNLANDVDLLQSRVESVTNDFLMLANTQYVENLVEEFEERNTVTPIANKSDENRVKTKAEKEAELITRMKEAIQIGLKTNSNHRVKTEVAEENEEFKIKRSHLIGTPKFFSSRYCGLVDENKTVKFTSSMPHNEQANFSDHSGDFSGKQELHLSGPIQESESDLDYQQGYPSSGLAFRREGSMSSDDLSYGKVPVSTSSSSSIGVHPHTSQLSSNLPSSNVNTSSNLVSDLNNVLRSRMPPHQIESDESDDDFKPPPPGQGRKLFADPEDNEEDFFGSSAIYPANRYVDNDDDDFFDPPPKLAISNNTGPKSSSSNYANLPNLHINNPIREDLGTRDSPAEVPPDETTTNCTRTRTQVQSNPAHDFSAVINQIKSASNIKDKSHQDSHPQPVATPSMVIPTSNIVTPGVPANNDKKVVKEPETKQRAPQTVKIKTTSNILTKENQDFQKLSVPPPVVHSDSHNHRQRKVKQSIFDDSDSDDIFSSGSSSSSKRKDGKLQNKDNPFTASSRSLSSNGGGSSLFGGDEPEDTFREKNYNRSSNDSLPNETVKPSDDKNRTSRTQNMSKEKVKKSIFDDSDSDDDLFSSRRSKVIGKPETSLFQEPVIGTPVKTVPKKGSNPTSSISGLDEDGGNLFNSKTKRETNKKNTNLSLTSENSIPTSTDYASEIKSAQNLDTTNSIQYSAPLPVTAVIPTPQTDIKQTDGINKDGHTDTVKVSDIERNGPHGESIFEPIKGRVNRLQSQEELGEDKGSHSSQTERLKSKPITQSKSNSFVRNAALNLKINPLALKPGAKPPSAKLEEPSDSDVKSIAASQPDPIILAVEEKPEIFPTDNKKEPEKPKSEHKSESEQSNEVQPRVSELFSGRRSDDIFSEKSAHIPNEKEANTNHNDDIFSESATNVFKPGVDSSTEILSTASSSVPANVQSKPVQTRNSVFDDSDSDGDLFTLSAKNSKLANTETNSSDIKNSFLTSSQGLQKESSKLLASTVVRPRSLFNDDDDSSDIFFGPKHTANVKNASTKPGESLIPVPVTSSPVVVDNDSEIKVPSSVSIISEPRSQPKPVKVKNSIFDDSDSGDDDLFKSISTRNAKKGFVEQNKTQSKANAKSSKNSLFTDDADDDTFLFNPRNRAALKNQSIPAKSTGISPPNYQSAATSPRVNSPTFPVAPTSPPVNSPTFPVAPTSPRVNSPTLPDAPTSIAINSSNFQNTMAEPPGITTENANELTDDIDVRVRLDTESSDTDLSDKKPQTGLTNIKKLGISLNINPLALRPGSKPSTPTGEEVPCPFGEISAGSESLLTGVVKNRVKIAKRRRLPTRKPPSTETDDNLFGIPNPSFENVDTTDQSEPPDIESSSEG